MFRRFQHKLKRGFVLISTLFIGTICIIIVLVLYKLELQQKNYASSYKNYVTIEDVNSKYRELLLTRLVNFININISILSKENISSFFISNVTDIHTDDHKAKVVYDSVQGCFKIDYYIDEYYHKEEFYNFQVNNGEIYFAYKGSLHVEGRLI